ncbi:hypothetical protein [Sebaldella sp. S0638]|uniref:hypothetical protein n=1 Tax=Sebaldella sp. S0638 TaxID=2957809 RepID=UPI0020A20AFE|nr:hypothetical protein [Sebaldella sp. S0638]MCP1226191.1 hypothetical protein [Sebaldella sp. S0638]
MRDSKKILLFTLALSTLLLAQASTDNIPSNDYNKLQDTMTENFNFGVSNNKNYDLIEKSLRVRNKELKDLYRQGDYIVKPEYLEWQVFFTGFYENKHRGGNSNNKPYQPITPIKDTKIEPEPRKGIVTKILKVSKKATVQYKSSIEVIENVPYEIKLEAPTTVGFPEINIGDFTPVTVNLTTPRIPETIDVNVTASSPVVIVGTPQVNKFIILTPQGPEIQAPLVNDIPIIKTPITPQVPTVLANEFTPVTFNITPPALSSPPVFNIKLGSFCNYMIPNCTGGTDGGGLSGNPMSFGDNGTNYNIALGSTTGRLGGTTLTANTPAIRYSWGTSKAFNSTLLKVYFDYGSQSAGGSAILTSDLTIDSINTLTTAQKVTENAAGRTWNTQGFLVGGSRIATLDNAVNASLINNGTVNLIGPLVVGFEVQSDLNGSGKRELINRKTITDAGETTSTALNTVLPLNTTVNLALPAYAGGGTVAVTRNPAGFTGYKVGIILTFEDNDARPASSYLLTNEATGLIDFKGEKSIGIQVYAPGSENIPARVLNQGTINIGGIESYGLKLSSRVAQTGMVFNNTGTINVSGVNVAGNSRSSGMAIIEDTGLTGNSSIRAYTGVAANTGTINVSGGAGNSGMILKVTASDNITNTGTINVSGTSNLGMRVDYGTVAAGGNGTPTAINTGTINVNGTSDLGIIANGFSTTVLRATGTNSGIIQVVGNNSAGLFSINGGNVVNTATATKQISVTGTNSIGMVVVDATSTGTNSGIINVSGNSSAGVYNIGTFTMTAGSITASTPSSIGVYAKTASNTNLNGGTITVSGGSTALYSENAATIKLLNPTIINVNDKSLMFYRSGTGALSGTANANINNGGTAFYITGGNTPNISSLVTTGNLALNMATGSTLVGWDQPTGILSLNALSSVLGTTAVTNTTINDLSGGTYRYFVINKSNVLVDRNTTLTGTGSQYFPRVNFVSSSIQVGNGFTITGIGSNQIGIAQRNYTGSAGVGAIVLNNSGTISLSGSVSTGIAGDFATITNTGTITTSGDKSTGIFGANSSVISNTGTINVGTTGTGNSGIGIYGTNKFDAATVAYGTGTVNITNTGNILYNGAAASSGVGIYVDNNNLLTDATITLNTPSNIDMSASSAGVGIFTGKAIVNINGGVINAGTSTGIYAIGGSQINASSGSIKIGTGGVGVYLAGNSQYNETGAQIGKFVITGDGASLLSLEPGSIFSLSASNIDNTTSMVGTSYKFILGSIGKVAYTSSTTTNIGSTENATIFGTTGGVISLTSTSNLFSNGANTVGVGVSGPKDSTVSYIVGPYEVTNAGKITLNGDKSTAIYVKGGAKALNSAGVNMISVGTNSAGMYAEGLDSVAQNNGNIVISTGSVGLYSSAVKSILVEAGVINNGQIKAKEITPGVFATDVTGIYVTLGNEGYQKGGTIQFSGDGSTGIFNEGNFKMSGGILTLGSLGGVAVYSKGAGSNTEISNGTINVSDGSVALYADGSTITVSGGAFDIGTEGLLMYNYPSGGIGTEGQLKIINTPTATIHNRGMAFYVEGQDLTGISGVLNSLVSNSSTGTMFLDMENGSSLLRWNKPINTLTLSGIPSIGIVNGIDYTTNTAPGTDYKKYSINLGDLIIDENVALTFLGNAYNGIEMSRSKVTLTNGYTITDSLDGQVAMAQTNYKRVTPAVTDINDIVVANNGTINLTKNQATGMAADYGLINNNASGILSLSGENSVGILAANGSIVTNNGTINVSGKETVGIYARNYFDGTATTSSGLLGYGDDSINVTHNGIMQLLPAGTLNAEVYGIYLDNNGVVANNKSNLTLDAASEIIIGDNNTASTNRSIGISLINSTLNSAGKIEVGVNGLGVYAKNSTLTGAGGVRKLGENSVGYYFDEVVDSALQIGSVEINGAGSAVYKISDYISSGINIFDTGNIELTSTSGGTFIVGMIGQNRSVILNDEIIIKKALNNILKGIIISTDSASLLFDTGFKITSEEDGIIGIGTKGKYTGATWADLTNPGYDIVFNGEINLKDDSVGIYSGEGTGILNNTAGVIKIGANSIGIYSTDTITASTILNKGLIQITGVESTGLRADGLSIITNTGTIESQQDVLGNYPTDVQGIIITNGATGNNSGTITLNGDRSVGIYNNNGIVNITGGNVSVNANQSVGVYSKGNLSNTLVNGGIVEARGSAVALYAEDSTINLDNGATIKANDNGILFYTSFTGATPTGYFNLVSGTVQAEIGAGGTGFYQKGDSSDAGIQTFLNSIFTGTGTLNVKLTDQSARLFVIESTGGTTNLSSLVPGSLTMLTGTKVSVDPASVTSFSTFLINKGELIIDQNVDLDNANNAYNNSEFTSSKITVLPGIIMTGSLDNERVIAQKNFAGGVRSDIVLNNSGGVINLSGENSVAIVADYGEITNSGIITISGENSIALLGANGSKVENKGTIDINSPGVGIYGVNLLGAAPAYGDKKIEIVNNGAVTSVVASGKSFGILAANADTAILKADSIVTLGTSSLIDMSASTEGVGVFANRSTLTVDGGIKVGENGIGIYGENTEVGINSLALDLVGNNAAGLYLAGNENLTVTGNVEVNVSGTNAAIFYFDSTGSITGLGENLRIQSIAPGASFILGLFQTAQFNFTNSFINVVELGTNNVTAITGENSVVRFGTNVTVNGTGEGQTGIAVDGLTSSTVPFIIGYAGYEVVNEGQINLQRSSTGIYAKNGARAYNSGIINVGDNATGISVKDSGSKITNYGDVTVGKGSDALYIKDGDTVSNFGNLNAIKIDVIGIHSDNLTGSIDNAGTITLLGDRSVGIYTGGAGIQVINNTGTITVGNSTSILDSSAGIYYDNVVAGIINSNNIIAGNQSVGIYNAGSTVNQNGLLKIGNQAIGIYFDGGTATFSPSSQLEMGDKSVGVYGLSTGTVNVNSNNDVLIGKESFGFVLTKGGTFNNTSTGKVQMIGDSTYIYTSGAANIFNTSDMIMNGDNNSGFVVIGGNVANNGNVIGTTGVGNVGIYLEDGAVVNNGNMDLGDSMVLYNSDGTVDTTNSNYSVGIYGVNSTISNSSASTIRVGKDGAGIYGDSSQKNMANQPTMTNDGTILSNSSGAFGMYSVNMNTINNGLIELTGDDSTGIVVQNSKVTNNGTIITRGDNSSGIRALTGSIIDNNGSIQIYGANSTGLLTTSGTVILNSGNIYIDPSVSSTSNATKVDILTSSFVKPILRTSGLVVVNDNFRLEGLDLIITPDPTRLQMGKAVGPDNEEHDFIIYSSAQPYFQSNSLAIIDPIIVVPTYTLGTTANTYKIENVILTSSGQITTPTGSLLMKSGSLTWDITPVKNLKGGYDIYAQRKDYNLYTGGSWYEGFGKTLEDNYLTGNGKDEKSQIYDKIDQITNEESFRKNISSLAGDVYANINQREKTISDIFNNSLELLKNSKNNTKENVKINVIVGKGTVKENTSGVLDYDYETSGVFAIREVERTYGHTFGYSLGYAHTSFEFNDGNDSEEWVDTIQLGVHNKYKSGDWILTNDLLGRVSNHNIDRNIDWDVSGRSEMNGNFQTYSIKSDNLFGREIGITKNSNITPYAGLEIMYVMRPTFEEDGLERLKVKGSDAWSVKPKAGIKLDGSIPLGTKSAWKLKGILDLAYEYELGDLNEREKARLVSVEDGYHNLAKPEDEAGILKTRIEIGTEQDNRYGFFLTGEYSAGSQNQEDFRVGVSLKAVF